MDQPSIRELLTAVRDFLETRAMPELKGHTAFHARVAANALGIVARQLELYGQASEGETERLVALLGHDGTLEELNRELCARIRAGEFTLETPGLAAPSRNDDARQSRHRPTGLFGVEGFQIALSSADAIQRLARKNAKRSATARESPSGV